MSQATQKSGRIALRTDARSEKRIRLAASLRSQSVSAFMLEAATELAEVVIAEANEVTVPADFFDAMWKALSKKPRVNAKLAAAMRAPRFVQR